MLNTGYHIHPHEWDEKRGLIVVAEGAGNNGERKAVLQLYQSKVNWEMEWMKKIVAEKEKSARSYTVVDLQSAFRRLPSCTSVFCYIQSQITKKVRMKCYGTARTYASALRSFGNFRTAKDLGFDEMSGELMQEYEAWLLHSGLKHSSTSCYIRTLRTLYRQAVEEGLAEDNGIFRKVHVSVGKTRKRAVSADVIRAIQNLDLADKPGLDFARDIFIFSFYTRGMSFVDIAHLRKSDLRNGVLTYNRRKTFQSLTIQWERPMQAIVNRYAEQTQDSSYLFPIITGETLADRVDYEQALQRINRNLKRIGAMIGLSVPLTTYVARHSWASIARNMDVPLSVISEGLGHDSDKTTQIYLASLDTSMINKANKRIINRITRSRYKSVTGNPESLSKSVTTTGTNGASETNPSEVLSFYVLVDKNEEPQARVTVAYDGDAIEVANVPIRADYRTVLKGDLTALAFPMTTVTATLDQIWDGDEVENIVFNVTSKSADDLLQYLNNTVGNKTGMTVRLSGTLTDEHFTAALREFLSDHEDANLTLDLSQTKNTTIPRYAFYYIDWVDSQVKTWDSKGLSSIILPECLTTIEPWAFKGCSNLKSVDLTHVTNIGRYAFNGCSSLSDITFPGGDFNIQGGVFTETAWLKQFSEFTIPSTWIFADDYGYGLLHESHIVSVTIPEDYKGSYVNLLWKTESLESVTIEGDITSIGEACFHLCKKLTTLDLSACTQVPVIEDYAFGGVGNETDVTQITVYVKDADMEAKFEAEDSPWMQQGFTKEKIQVKP